MACDAPDFYSLRRFVVRANPCRTSRRPATVASPCGTGMHQWATRKIREAGGMDHGASGRKGNGAAVVICPGGGYRLEMVGARRARDCRVAQSSRDYRGGARLSASRGPAYVPLLDAQRGSCGPFGHHAKEWDLDPSRSGSWGFSAGGHLASTAATHFDEGNPAATDRDRPDQLPARFCDPHLSGHHDGRENDSQGSQARPVGRASRTRNCSGCSRTRNR